MGERILLSKCIKIHQITYRGYPDPLQLGDLIFTKIRGGRRERKVEEQEERKGMEREGPLFKVLPALLTLNPSVNMLVGHTT
jgi:hypothetical protein